MSLEQDASVQLNIMRIRNFVGFLASLTLPIIWSPTGSQAITIDSFQDEAVLSSSVVGETRTLYSAAPGAIGGSRSFSASKVGAGSGVSRLEVVDGSLGYTQGAHAGLGIVTWDGDSDATSVNSAGLGGVDLTQDDSTAFQFGLTFFDYPFNQPIQIILRVYDASVTDGTKFSEISVSLNQLYDGPGAFTLSIPFSLLDGVGLATIPAPGGQTFSTFTVLGSNGAANARNVGAITLTFNGTSNSKAPDVILSAITTNGRCAMVPDANRKVIDECGVCLNNANALKGKDKCGTCLFGAPSYTYVDRTNNCDPSKVNCVRVKPTAQIKQFETDLLDRALSLKNRFIADANRSASKQCGIDLALSDELVGTAFDVIAAKGREVFRRGIWVCDSSCVTVSFASDVEGLMPQFKILERETAKTAKKVQKCYRALGISGAPIKGGAGAAKIISDVRAGVASIIRACKKNKVCRKQ